MTRAALAALLMLASGGGGEADEQARPPAGGTITFHQQIIIVRTPVAVRVPGPAASANATPIRWREHRGPRCIAWSRIAGVGLLAEDSVDFLLRDGTRLRARLQHRCPALDYYNGFYLAATPDGLTCADRDSIRARTGGQCQIDQFRSLTAGRR